MKKHPNARFHYCHPKASSMLSPALTALRKGDFKDVAYFEPFYLKEFVATVSKKKLSQPNKHLIFSTLDI